MTRITCPECLDGILEDPPIGVSISTIKTMDLKTAINRPIFSVERADSRFICLKCKAIITVVTCIEIKKKDGSTELRKL